MKKPYYTAGKQWSWALNPGRLVPEPFFFNVLLVGDISPAFSVMPTNCTIYHAGACAGSQCHTQSGIHSVLKWKQKAEATVPWSSILGVKTKSRWSSPCFESLQSYKTTTGLGDKRSGYGLDCSMLLGTSTPPTHTISCWTNTTSRISLLKVCFLTQRSSPGSS